MSARNSTADHNKLVDVINDDELAESIAIKCNSRSHDDRWCPTCESRGDGIESYRIMLIQVINKQND